MTTTTYDDRAAATSPPLLSCAGCSPGQPRSTASWALPASQPHRTSVAGFGIGAAAVRVTGGVFLLAALAGAITLRRPRMDVRLIAGANLLFALWCLVMLGLDSPNALGVVLLLGAAATSAGTAVAEHRLAR